MAKKFVECLECGTMHYIVNKKEADSIKADGYLVDEFSDRNLAFCSHCGSKSKFSTVADDYVETHGTGRHIQPIFLDDGELKSTTKKEP